MSTVIRSLFLIADLEGLPEKGDAVDWIEAQESEWDGYNQLPIDGDDVVGLREEFCEAVDECQTEFLSDKSVPLQFSLPSVGRKPYPVESLGKPLSILVRDVAAIVKVPVEICAQSVLTTVSMSVQGLANIEHVGAPIPLSIFALSIAESGGRKSTVDDILLLPVEDVQRERQAAFDSNYKEAKLASDVYNEKKKYLLSLLKKKSISVDDTAKQIADELGEEPDLPVMPLMIVRDITLEGLYGVLESGNTNLGFFSDEGGQFVGGHAMNEENWLKSASGLSNIWGAKIVSSVRRGTGVTYIENSRVTMHLMMQPGVARRFSGDKFLVDQGLMNRFLMAFPESLAGTRFIEENARRIKNSAAYNTFCTRIRELLRTQTGEVPVNVLTLTDEAERLWRNFFNDIEAEQAPGGEYEHMRGYAGRAGEHCKRFAGILQLFEDPKSDTVSAENMECAIGLTRWYVHEAKYIFEVQAQSPEEQDALKIWDWIVSGRRAKPPEQPITGTELSGRAQVGAKLRKRDQYIPAMKVLADWGYVEYVAQGNASTWEINLEALEYAHTHHTHGDAA